MVPCEPLNHLEVFAIEETVLYYDKRLNDDATYIEIDYESDWSGAHWVVTAGF